MVSRNLRNVVMVASLLSLVVVAQVRTAEAQELTRLAFQLHQVKAVDECGSTIELGADDMKLAAITIEPGGRVRRIPTMNLGEFGHDGTTKKYSKELLSFEVGGSSFPKRYQAVLVLAETDPGGGFANYLKKLTSDFQKVAGDKTASRPATSPQGPRLVLAGFGDQAEAIAADLASRIADRVLAEARDELKSRWNDEIFPPQLQQISIPRANFRFPGGAATSAQKTVRFSAHSCKYDLTYSWRLK